jgi:hypothetical protein
VVALLDRLLVEERRQPRQRQRVVIDGVGDVLLGCGELVGDLLAQPFDEALCGHIRSW